jgi:hypothetical protein
MHARSRRFPEQAKLEPICTAIFAHEKGLALNGFAML